MSKPASERVQQGGYADIDPASNPGAHRQAIRRLVSIGLSAPDETVDRGRNWHEHVRAATSSGAHDIGVSNLAAAGMVAAVSPGMDFDKLNIAALHQVRDLTKSNWAMISRDHRSDQPRSSETAAMLGEKAPALGRANSGDLMKVHSLLHGADPDTVLSSRTAAKTNAFMHNIDDPDSQLVTVDGRQHDMAIGHMLPWDEKRGIGSAGLPSGRMTRNEHFQQATISATKILGRQDSRWAGMSGMQGQAGMWLRGQEIERTGTTKAGKPRQQGPMRLGQPYL